MATDVLEPLMPNQGPPDTTAQANLVPFIAPDANVNSYDPTVQQPLHPLVPTQQQATPQPVTSQANNDLTEDQALIAQIKQRASKGQGVGPHILATLAALSGNFGPAMMLEEQKRKTALAIDAAPLIVKANRYKNQGEYEKAVNLLQEGMGQFGARSPEIAQHLTREIEGIDKKSQEWGAAESTYKALVAQAKHIKLRTGQDALYAPDLPVMQDIIDKKAPGGEKAFANILEMIKGNQVQQYKGGVRITNTGSGVTTEKPMTSFVEADDLKGIPGETMAAIYKMPAVELTKAMNGQPFVQDGQEHQGSSIVANALKAHLATLQGPEAQRNMAKLVPTSQAMNEQLRKVAAQQGMSSDEFNQRGSTNNFPPEMVLKAYTDEIAKGTQLVTAGFEAQLKAPVVASNLPLEIRDKETGQLRPYLSVYEARDSQDKYSVLNKVGQSDKADKLYTIRDRLDLIKTIIDKLPSSDANVGRLSEFIDRYVNDKLGLDPNTTADRAIQHVLKNDIEDYFNKQGTSAERMADLTRPLTDRSSTKEGAQATWNTLKAITDSDRHRLMDQESKVNLPKDNNQQYSSLHDVPGFPKEETDTANSIIKEAKIQGVDPALALAVGHQESGFKMKVGDGGNAHGIFQLHVGAASDMTMRPEERMNKSMNIAGGVGYLGRQVKAAGGNIPAALLRYNGGGDPNYVQNVMPKYEAYKKALAGQTTAPTSQVSPPTAKSTPTQDAEYRAQQKIKAALSPTTPESVGTPNNQGPPVLSGGWRIKN